MEFVWDESKRRANLRKHGIDFIGCEAVFAGRTLTAEDLRFQYDERRYVTIGLWSDRVVAVVHTETLQQIRIISIRKATRGEQKHYFEGVKD
ncbi:MAG TPA: BrnT family toxin [Casimicrobiaceae bacterium]